MHPACRDIAREFSDLQRDLVPTKAVSQEEAAGGEHDGLQLSAAGGVRRVRCKIEIRPGLPVVTHVERQRYPRQCRHLAGDGDQRLAHGRGLPGGAQ